MTERSTTIRVSLEQRERLRRLGADREATMAATLDAALEALRRDQFYRSMVEAERSLRSDAVGWADYVAERDTWLNPDLAS